MYNSYIYKFDDGLGNFLDEFGLNYDKNPKL